ncbi:MAG: hypothetical protein K2L51_07130, partial [Clostridiales bacterium]|nr:hypothetical protein [Clostridiales bacterium]
LQPSDTGQSTATALHYKADKELLFYEGDALSKKNQSYRLSFAQLGRVGINGERAKIMTNTRTESGYFDQVQVFIADSADTPDAVYRELSVDGLSNTDNLSVYFRFDGNDYPRDALRFAAKKAGTSTVKLVANAFNGAPQQYEIYVQLTFKSSDSFGKITEIVCTDPYTGKPTNTLDLYHDAIAGGNAFVLSDYITVKRGASDDDKVSWGMNGLRGTVTQDNNNQVLKIDPNVSAGFAITADLPGGHKTGTATVTVRDTDPDGFGTELAITVRVLAPITGLTPKTEELTANSGADVDLNVTYTLPAAYLGQADYQTTLANLNRALNVTYPDGKLPTPTFANNTVNNRDKTVVPVGLASDYKVTPTLVRNGDSANYAAKITLRIGKDVASGDYKLRFALQPQGFVAVTTTADEAEHKYTPKEALTVDVTLHVTQLADSIGVQEPTWQEDDKYTEISGNGTQATLTLGVGTGKQDTAGTNNAYYTQFSLYDILKFVLNKDELTTPATRQTNYEKLTITGDLSKVFAGSTQAALLTKTDTADDDAVYGNARFIVPQTVSNDTYAITIKNGNYTLTLTVEYKVPVKGLHIDTELTHVEEISYGRVSNGSISVPLGNLTKDKVQLQGVTGAITNLNHIKHPEWLRIDVTVLIGSKAYRLPKKTVGGNVYFFTLDTTDAQLREIDTDVEARNVALFQTETQSGTYTTPWKDQGITAIRDLFAVSVEKGIDYQNIRLYYSYGANELSGATDSSYHNYFVVQDTPDNKDYIARANYKLIRHVDELHIYKSYNQQTGQYSDRIDDKSTSTKKGVDIVSGGVFDIYVVRVFTVNNNNKYYMAYGDTHFNCHAVAAPQVASVQGSIKVEQTGIANQYRATCEGNTGAGTVTFHTECKDTSAQQKASLAVSVSNTVTRIQSITLYSDANRTGDITDATILWLHKNGTNATVTIWYTIVYHAYTDADSSLEKFEGILNGLERKTSSTLPSFTTAPSSINPADVDGLTKNGNVFTYKGYITLGAASLPNGDYTFGVDNSSNLNVTAKIRVTTLIEADKKLQFAFTDDRNAEKKLKDGETYQDVIKFTYAIQEGKPGDY